MSDELYGPDDGPGKWVCGHCGSDKLTFEGDGTWNTETQQMDFEEACEKPFCQQCEGREWATFVPLPPKRGEPQLSRDYYGDLFIVIDDDGEPVSPYYLRLKRAREWREDYGGKAELYRIVKVAFKALPRDDGEPDEIVDDPLASRREDD